MRDRQQREMCVWCDDLNAAQTRRGDAAGSTTAAAPTAPNTTSVPSTTAVAAAPATASATAAPSSSSSSSTAAAAARPAADVDGVSAMLEDDVDPLPLPASAAAAAGTNTPAGATVPESSSPSSGPVRYSMRTPVGSPAVTNTTNAAAAAAAPNTPNGQQIAAAATFTTPTRGGGAPAQHSPSLGASGMRRAMLDSPSIRNASQLPDSLLARLNGVRKTRRQPRFYHLHIPDSFPSLLCFLSTKR